MMYWVKCPICGKVKKTKYERFRCCHSWFFSPDFIVAKTASARKRKVKIHPELEAELFEEVEDEGIEETN